MHPTTNIDYLNEEYDITDYLKENFDTFNHIRKELHKIRDVERLYRKIILNKVYPCEIAQYYNNMKTIMEINEILSSDEKIQNYLKNRLNIDIVNSCRLVWNILIHILR